MGETKARTATKKPLVRIGKPLKGEGDRGGNEKRVGKRNVNGLDQNKRRLLHIHRGSRGYKTSSSTLIL